MTVHTRFLVIKANGRMRIKNSERGSLLPDEVAFPLVVDIPDEWGEIADDAILLQMPAPPTVTREKP